MCAKQCKQLQNLNCYKRLVYSLNQLVLTTKASCPSKICRSCWCFAFTICLFDINGRYFALILFFSKCYFFSFLSLLFQRGAEIYSYFYFSEGQNFIGLISTADLGRWQLSDPPSTFHTEHPTQKDFLKNPLLNLFLQWIWSVKENRKLVIIQ